MTKQNRPQPDRDTPTYSPHTDEFDTDPANDDTWTEEEMERATMGWQAQDEQLETLEDTTPAANFNTDVDEDELEAAADALTDMAAREIRRDQILHSSGKDYSAGFESVINMNDPKDDELTSNKARRQSRSK